MTYVATVSPTGNIISIGTNLSGTIPQGQVVLTPAQFQSIAANPVGWTWVNGAPVAPAPVSNLQQLANAQLAQVAASFAAANAAPVTYTNSSGVTATFPTTSTARHLVLETLLAFTASDNEVFPWADVNGNMVNMTYADLQGLLRTGGQRNLENLKHYMVLTSNIQDATTAAGITSQVW